MPFRRVAMFLALALIQPVAWAETCKYLDSEGRIIYSNTPNTPPKGASKVKCFEDPVARPSTSGNQNTDSNAAGAPKTTRISPDTQKSRDGERRRILEQELADETQKLAQAREQLAAQEAIRNGNERNYERVLERLKPYQDAIATHGRNIEAIQREIANLK